MALIYSKPSSRSVQQLTRVRFLDAQGGYLRAVVYDSESKRRRFIRLGNANTVATALYLVKSGYVAEGLRLLSEAYFADPDYIFKALESSLPNANSACLELSDRLLELFLATRKGETEKRRYISILGELFSQGPICSVDDIVERTREWPVSRKSRAKVFFNWLSETTLVPISDEQRRLAHAISEILPAKRSNSRAPEVPDDATVQQWAEIVRVEAPRKYVAVWNILVVSGARLAQVLRAIAVGRELKVLAETEHVVVLFGEPVMRGRKYTVFIVAPRSDWFSVIGMRMSADSLREWFARRGIRLGLVRAWSDNKLLHALTPKLGLDAKRISDYVHGHIKESSVRHYQLKWLAETISEAVESIWHELEKFLA